MSETLPQDQLPQHQVKRAGEGCCCSDREQPATAKGGVEPLRADTSRDGEPAGSCCGGDDRGDR